MRFPKKRFKRDKEKVKKPKVNAVGVHARIFTLEHAQAGRAPIKAIITDLDRHGMGLLSFDEIEEGTPVVVDTPGNIAGKLQAIVTTCHPTSSGRNVLEVEDGRRIYRLCVRAIIGGKDEAEFPDELLKIVLGQAA